MRSVLLMSLGLDRGSFFHNSVVFCMSFSNDGFGWIAVFCCITLGFCMLWGDDGLGWTAVFLLCYRWVLRVCGDHCFAWIAVFLYHGVVFFNVLPLCFAEIGG